MWRERQRLEWWVYKPRIAKDCWQPPEARREAWNRFFPLKASESTEPCWHLNFWTNGWPQMTHECFEACGETKVSSRKLITFKRTASFGDQMTWPDANILIRRACVFSILIFSLPKTATKQAKACCQLPSFRSPLFSMSIRSWQVAGSLWHLVFSYFNACHSFAKLF